MSDSSNELKLEDLTPVELGAMRAMQNSMEIEGHVISDQRALAMVEGARREFASGAFEKRLQAFAQKRSASGS